MSMHTQFAKASIENVKKTKENLLLTVSKSRKNTIKNLDKIHQNALKSTKSQKNKKLSWSFCCYFYNISFTTSQLLFERWLRHQK